MSAKPTRRGRLPLTVAAIDVFCGAGGLTRGLLDAGIPVVAGYDIDCACRYAYEHNNPPAVFVDKDVEQLKGCDLPRRFVNAERRILVGCAPCAPFSKYTRKQRQSEHAKWPLLNEYSRLVREVKPDVVTMENVAELQLHNVFDDFLETLRSEGFHFNEDAEARIVFCPDYGIPQQRSRLVLLASKLGPIELLGPTHKNNHPTVRDALTDLPPLNAGETDANDCLHRSSRLSETNLKRIKSSRPGGTWRDWPKNLVAECHKKDSGATYPSVYGRMSWNEPSPTITTQFFGFGNGRFGHPSEHRALSLREGAILQSFPRQYQFAPPTEECSFAAIGRMIGNAVPVRLGEVIGKAIGQHLAAYEVGR